MTEIADCRCETILSPQFEYVPGPHHEVGCDLRREPARESDTTLADTGSFFVRVPKEPQEES